jgi:hypothetical protein
MKITIDTKTDSHADIQKVIQILSHLNNQENITNNYQPESQETTGSSNTGFMNMFGDTSKEDKPDATLDFSNILNSTQKEEEEKKEIKPKLQFF